MSDKTISNKIVFHSDAVIYNPYEVGEIAAPEDFHFLKKDGDVITITPLMKEILEHARTPQTAEELATWFSIKQHCSYETIYPSVNSFLQRMMKFGAVVTEESTQKNYSNSIEFDEIERCKKIDRFVLLDRV